MKESRSLWQTARELKGNQRAGVIAEPLWALPYNIFQPFASIYMMAIGLRDGQIGVLASLGLALQFFWSIFSGAIVDKFGRRRTMLLFGILSWSVPCLFWTVARDYWWFVVAVFFNSMWRVNGNCFSCLMVEDGDDDQLINLFTIFNLIGLVVGFLLPVVGFFINRFSLIVTMRVVYGLSAMMMCSKFIVQFSLTRECEIGVKRMRESKGRSLLSLTFGGWSAFVSALRTPRLLLLMTLMALTNCFNTVQATFWPLFVTSAYQVSASTLSWFPPVKGVITAAVFLLITPHINLRTVRRPLLAGFAAQGLGLAVLLLFRPVGASALAAVFFSAICEAFALAVLNPLCDSLMSVSIPSQERARVYSLIIAVIILVSMPIGWIAGLLSQMNRMLPFILNLGLLAAEIVVALFISRAKMPGESTQNRPAD